VQRDVGREVITKDPATGDITKKFKSITYKTAWRMLQQIRIAMANRETEHIFEAFIEVDETRVGGRHREDPIIKKGNQSIQKYLKTKGAGGQIRFPLSE
jgi:hypothetical protein